MTDLLPIDGHDEDEAKAEDLEGRAVLVQTIRRLAARVRTLRDVRLFLGDGIDPLDQADSLAGHPLWLLAEFLCILILLDEAESVETRLVFGLRRTPPHSIPFVRAGQKRFLWIQPTMRGRQSGFPWRPDLVITETGDAPSADNVLEIVECKSSRKLDSVTIRSEFAKGFDLEAPAYLIWSYFEPTLRVHAGATGLGVQLRTIGLVGKESARLRDPDELTRRIAEGMRETRETMPLAAALARAASTAAEKADRGRRIPRPD